MSPPQPTPTMSPEPTLASLTAQNSWTAASALLRTLPNSSARLETSHNNWTALHHAASATPTPALLQQLLSHGASPHASGPAGSTPLHLAAWHGTDAVEPLLTAGADGNACTESGRTPLHFAARMGRTDVVRVLLEAGCVDRADCRGVSARELAVREGFDEVVTAFEEFEKGEGEVVEEEDGEGEGEGEERGVGKGMGERVRSLVETVGTDVMVAGGVGFLLGTLVPRKK